MFLKRLESVGFKSFAERIQIDFVSGVTAVVGPNGSGKSNVIDAIRWVLGEQSAKSLRGQKMEDIIFQGSDSRKALNFAEVSLILNNEKSQLPIDFQEVNVTRRVYRSGESEFYINKQSCRLKDIVDLFMDTGLGRESFSIIGQGKIDEILSSKADERRAVFEEAAGVLKYKQRKKKAEFKLMETADNLDRVKDIIYEIEQQMHPLKQQSETAQKFKVLQQELKETEIALLVTEIESLHAEWQTTLSELEDKKLIELNTRTAIQKREANLTEKREQIQELEGALSNLQNELLQATEKIEQLEGKRNVLLERTKHIAENKEKLQHEKKVHETRLDELRGSLEEGKERLIKTTAITKELAENIKKLEAKLALTPEEISEQIDDLKSDYIEDLNEQAVIQNDIHRINEQLKQITDKQSRQTNSYVESTEREKELSENKARLEQLLHDLKMDTENNEHQVKSHERNLETVRKEYETMQQKLFAGNEKIAGLTSRKEMLEEMKDSYQGFFYGAKEILQAKQRNAVQGVVGAVIDLIDIPGTYMTAMETILGSQAQFIVVNSDREARELISWLKRENKGRATFLPLESISERNIPDYLQHKLNTCEGFIDIAANLVHTDPAYNRLKHYLLGNVIVAQDLKSANQLANITNRKYRITTLDGDVVHPGGSMSGGARKKNNQSLFTREKEISELKTTLTEYRKRAAQYEEKVESQRTKVISFEREIAADIKKLDAQKHQIDELQTELHQATIAYSRITDQLNNYRAETEAYDKEKAHLSDQLTTLDLRLTDIKNNLLHKEEKIESLTSEKEQSEENKKATEQELNELKLKQAEQEERQRAEQEKQQALQGQFNQQQNEMMAISQQLEELLDEAERKEKEKDLAAQISELKQSREQIAADIDVKRGQKNSHSQVTEDEEKEIKGLNFALEQETKAVQQLEVQANRMDVTLENHLTSLQDEYRITYERASAEYEKTSDLEGSRQKVKTIKTSIERLGSVNLGAIEEYERISERHEFLAVQENDLLSAKETLYKVIKEMDEEMTKRFSEVFHAIQGAFTVVFSKLFGGGHAELSLTDPDDMLETGVEIIARPPGKKLKTLGLLSGGERALTAIALLFAILKVRPVPFCILDEVDAALDEANVERFGHYLQTFSNDTQFIVITHRKGTMEEADALYGITMQESGVSRLVSVKLEDTKSLVGIT